MTGITTVSTFKIILMMLLSINGIAVSCSEPSAPSEDTVVIIDEHRSETRRSDGTVEGSYSHVDSNGIRRRTEYRVGPNGHEVAGVHEPLLLIANPVRSNDGPPGAKSTSDHHQAQIPSVEDLIRYTYRLD